jgi:hypothetical protein
VIHTFYPMIWGSGSNYVFQPKLVTAQQKAIDFPRIEWFTSVLLWPGTGEVGTTHGKESGNAEITIVIKYYSRKTTSV